MDSRGASGRSGGRARSTRGPSSTQPKGPGQQGQAASRGGGGGSGAWQKPAQQQQRPAQAGVGALAAQTERMQITPRGGGGGGDNNGGGRGGMRKQTLESMLAAASANMMVLKKDTVKQGSFGAHIKLSANYFSVTKRTNWLLYQYRVDFTPDEDRTSLKKALLHTQDKTIGVYVFDGTVLYTMHKLPEPFEANVMDRNNTPYVIKARLVNELGYGDPAYMQVYCIVLRKCLASLELQLVGRDYYDEKSKVVVPAFKFEVWPGFVATIRQAETDLLVNVDLSHKVMRLDTALDLLYKCQNSRGDAQAMFNREIVGSTVITRYNNKTYRIDDVDWNSSPSSTFEQKGEKVSYIDYNKKRYGLQIKEQRQPLLVSTPKQKDIRGGRNEFVMLVPELCCMTGLDEQMKANFNLMKELAIHTRINPSIRVQRLEQNFMGKMLTTPAVKAELDRWNMSFSPRLVALDGRLLPSETICLGQNQSVKANQEADWTREMVNKSLLRCTPLSNWSILFLNRQRQEVQNFVQVMCKAANSYRYQIGNPRFEELPNDRGVTYANAIEGIVNRDNPMLVLTVVPNNNADRYSLIKRKCCIDRHIPSQVVLAKNVGKANMSVCSKIAIQLSCKTGGAPWRVEVPFKEHVMICGFDVCHDTTSKGKSWGALVASMDKDFSTYCSAISAHTSGEELSSFMGSSMMKLVVRYRQINNGVPTKIIVYRDGVGEGNFQYALETEVGVIEKELAPIYQGKPVPIVYVIVSKRINTRFFTDRRENPRPGTVVDNVVTTPGRYDFFIISQSVKQGTVSPTSYTVIKDSINLPPDHLQRLTYKMCHIYFNMSATIRVPAQCQYAHKLAFLVAQYLHQAPNAKAEDYLYYL